VVHASIRDAAPHGFALASPGGPGVSEFLGITVPVGALDSAAIRTTFVDGLPTGYTAIPIEVKNLRDWIYPTSQELFQLLDKSAQLQVARPGVDMVPILVSRRVHITTMRMAKDLGFFVIPTRRQYITPSVDERLITEVRSGLGFLDLVATDEADRLITAYFVKHLPKVLDRTVERWPQSAGDLGSYFTALRAEGDIATRSRLLIDLKDYIRAFWGLDFDLGW
jgi:hypothetical protein